MRELSPASAPPVLNCELRELSPASAPLLNYELHELRELSASLFPFDVPLRGINSKLALLRGVERSTFDVQSFIPRRGPFIHHEEHEGHEEYLLSLYLGPFIHHEEHEGHEEYLLSLYLGPFH